MWIRLVNVTKTKEGDEGGCGRDSGRRTWLNDTQGVILGRQTESLALKTNVHLHDVSIVVAMEATLREHLSIPYCKTCIEPYNKVQSIESQYYGWDVKYWRQPNTYTIIYNSQ